MDPSKNSFLSGPWANNPHYYDDDMDGDDGFIVSTTKAQRKPAWSGRDKAKARLKTIIRKRHRSNKAAMLGQFECCFGMRVAAIGLYDATDVEEEPTLAEEYWEEIRGKGAFFNHSSEEVDEEEDDSHHQIPRELYQFKSQALKSQGTGSEEEEEKEEGCFEQVYETYLYHQSYNPFEQPLDELNNSSHLFLTKRTKETSQANNSFNSLHQLFFPGDNNDYLK